MEPDYTKMDGAELLNAIGEDATKWAAAFEQHCKAITDCGETIDRGFLIGWFANAIVRGQDEQRWRNERQAAKSIPVVQAITEEMGVHKDWYKERPKTPDELAAFVTRLLTEYHHDYGTICHAAAAAALAAAWTVNADEAQGGITGFQASAIMWQFIKEWRRIKGPMRLLEVEHMLFPQYANDFRTISLETFRWLQAEAQKRLNDGGSRLDPNETPIHAHPDVVAHWKRIADGEVPFGYQIKD